MDGFKEGKGFVEFLIRAIKEIISWFRSSTKVKKFNNAKAGKELQQLYQETKNSFDDSDIGNIEPNVLAARIVFDAANLAGITPTEAFINPFYDVIAEALKTEGFWFMPSEDILKIDDHIEHTEIRVYLNQLKIIYQDSENKLERIQSTLTQALITLFKGIKDKLVVDQDADVSLTVSLLDVIPELGLHAESFLQTFFDKGLRETMIFESYRQQYEINTLRVSGIDSDKVNTSNKEWVFPSDSKLERHELVNEYFYKPPFLSIFYARLPIGIPKIIRSEHTWIVAGTGHGKTQLLQKLICDDLDTKTGFMVIDGQGDLINNILSLDVFSPYHPNSLANKLVVIDPNDVEFPVCLNLFALNDYRDTGLSARDKEAVFNATVEMYTFLFGSIFGADLTQRQSLIFTYIARLMMEIPKANIMTFMRLLQDGKEFKGYMANLDGMAREFFRTEYFSTSFAATKKQVLTRLWSVMSNNTLQRMFSSTENKINLFKCMKEGKIVLVNTAKGLLREQGSMVVGRFLIAMLSQATMLRASQPKSERQIYNIYIDEVQDYIDETIGNLAAQARKYQVGLTLAHQFLNQLPEKIRASLATNTTTKIIGSVSNKDSLSLSEDLYTTREFIRNVKKRETYTEYSMFVKNYTESAMRVHVPFGVLERRPSLDTHTSSMLLDANRTLYCRSIDEIESVQLFEPFDSKTEQDLVIEQSITSEKFDNKTASLKAKPVSRAVESRIVRPYVPEFREGKGGHKHKFLQNMVKKIGHAKQYKVDIEKFISGGKSVDVVLDNGDIAIAIEISVTTDGKHELQNIRKCFDAGYLEVVVLCEKPDHLHKIRKYVCDTFYEEIEQKKLNFLLIDELENYLDKKPPDSIVNEQIIAGYKVKTNYIQLSTEELELKKRALARVILNN